MQFLRKKSKDLKLREEWGIELKTSADVFKVSYFLPIP
jgi:hypothetical protein